VEALYTTLPLGSYSELDSSCWRSQQPQHTRVVWPAEFLTIPRALEPQRGGSTRLGFLRSRLVAAQRRHRGLAKQRRVLLGDTVDVRHGWVRPGRRVVKCTSCERRAPLLRSEHRRRLLPKNMRESKTKQMTPNASRNPWRHGSSAHVNHGMASIDAAMWGSPTDLSHRAIATGSLPRSLITRRRNGSIAPCPS
jgi:hypothetical protein